MIISIQKLYSRLFGFYLFALFLFSCSTLGNLSDQKLKVNPICKSIQQTDRLLSEIPTDDVSVESLRIVGNCLSMEISYGGGCGSFELDLLYQNMEQTDGIPVLNLKPVFNDNDPCRAIVLDTIQFDLSVFESVARSGGIRLNIFGSEKSIFYALPLH
jgi:hypothetical protein